MRKLFLLGTMLGVAGTALAFGGIFNHGSKSTTYKGGVDAIGVHFGGEKKTADITADTPSCPEHSEWNGSVCECNLGWTLNEETNECECPEERRCGNTCCGADNVCHPELNVCCHQEYVDWGEDWMDVCCTTGSLGYVGERCCEIGEIIAGEDEKHCCPAGATHYEENPNTGFPICCSNETFFDGFCCPEGTVLKDDGYCCSPDSIGYGANPETDEGQCCEPGTKFAYDQVIDGYYCCPESSPGFGRNVAAGGKRQCCDPGTVLIIDEWEQRFCCPEGSTSVNDDGECI